MRRDYVDFHDIPERQLDMHARLENWARTLNSGPSNHAGPIFRLYQSSERFTRHESVRVPANAGDARKIAAAVALLPERQRKAVQWAYVMRSSVMAGRRYLACTAAELAALVVDARDMLVNRVGLTCA